MIGLPTSPGLAALSSNAPPPIDLSAPTPAIDLTASSPSHSRNVSLSSSSSSSSAAAGAEARARTRVKKERRDARGSSPDEVSPTDAAIAAAAAMAATLGAINRPEAIDLTNERDEIHIDLTTDVAEVYLGTIRAPLSGTKLGPSFMRGERMKLVRHDDPNIDVWMVNNMSGKSVAFVTPVKTPAIFIDALVAMCGAKNSDTPHLNYNTPYGA